MRARSTVPRCDQCHLQPRWCVCPDIPRVANRTEVVVVRHWKEALKPTNTGRLAPLALRRCTLLDYGVRGQPFDDAPIRRPGAWLVFPPPEGEPPPPPPSTPPAVIVIVDGTWAQARRMTNRITSLGALPRWFLDAPPRPAQRLRAPHAPWAMSTLEALAAALRCAEGDQVAGPLEALYDRFTHQNRLQRGFKD